MDSARKRRNPIPEGLSLEELEAQSAEALPERGAMSTLSVSPVDAAGGTVEAVSSGLADAADSGQTAIDGSDVAVDQPIDPAASTSGEPTDAATTSVEDGDLAATSAPVDSTAADAPDATATGADVPAEQPELPDAAQAQPQTHGVDPWADGGPGQGAEHAAPNSAAAAHVPQAPTAAGEDAGAGDAVSEPVSQTMPAVGSEQTPETLVSDATAPVDTAAAAIPTTDDVVGSVADSTAATTGAA